MYREVVGGGQGTDDIAVLMVISCRGENDNKIRNSGEFLTSISKATLVLRL